MRKSTRIATLIAAHTGLIVSILYLVCYLLYAFFPGFPLKAYPNFFLFDYFYLIIPVLCLASGILLQISATKKPKRRRKQQIQK
jgi:uncharacterized membrane protein